MDKKSLEDSSCCLECEHLIDDGGNLRCIKFYGAMIEDPDEKHCKDSIH